MKVIKLGQTFAASGAIVLTADELNVVLHALKAGHAEVVRRGGRSYGPMRVEDMSHLISSLEELRDQRSKSQRGA